MHFDDVPQTRKNPLYQRPTVALPRQLKYAALAILEAANISLVIAGNITISGGSLFVDGTDVGLAGSVFIESGGELKLRDTFLNLLLDYD